MWLPFCNKIIAKGKACQQGGTIYCSFTKWCTEGEWQRSISRLMGTVPPTVGGAAPLTIGADPPTVRADPPTGGADPLVSHLVVEVEEEKEHMLNKLGT